MVMKAWAAGVAIVALASGHALAAPAWTVKPEWVHAHEAFLASDALQGRGSATRDEAIAAAYVASRFEGYGLKPAPGIGGYLQAAKIVKVRLNGAAIFRVDGRAIEGATVLVAGGDAVTGALTIAKSAKPDDIPAADIVIATARGAKPGALARAGRAKHVKLVIVREDQGTRDWYAGNGGKTALPSYLENAPPVPRPAIVALPDAAFDALAKRAGAKVALDLPDLVREMSTTTNAIGYLPGSDPKGGVILVSAHLDHLGVRPDGVVMPGANDDASGTTAVLEIAHALATEGPSRRGILFVCYGSEEIGGFGSQYFGAHPPVPIADIVANLEFEMIGAQDPKLPAGTLMMTGFERSNLGEAIRAHGALVAADPYPDQHFFERSDNYRLALEGVVAHTISGWALPPTYHQPTDTYAALDLPFMTRAIQSLIEPVRWLATSDFRPAWKPRGRPVR